MLIEIYSRLPAPLKSVAASLHGYKLQALRYGRETEPQVEQALERDSWDGARWKHFQGDKLAALLHHAVTTVPFYRDHWAERRRKGDRASWELLENWPVLSKQSVRDDPHAFISEKARMADLTENETSGSTGTPLRLWQSRDMLVSWYALFEARIRRWNGVTLRDRWAHLGGKRVTPIKQKKPPFWVWNAGMRQLYMSTFHITPGVAAKYLDALRRYRIRYVFGYASAMSALASAMRAKGLVASDLAVAISNAEPVDAFQRDLISSVFQCPVRDTYGQAEIVSGASECAHGALHMWPEVGVTEWVRDDSYEPLAVGEAGRMLCTGLLNMDMPMIRYELGDRSTRAVEDPGCLCGRRLPTIRAVEGRSFDVALTPAGVPVGSLGTIFHSGLPMREAQIVQETLKRFRIKVVPAPGFAEKHALDLRRGLQSRIGESVEVIVETVETIARTPAGKFRKQISLLLDRFGNQIQRSEPRNGPKAPPR